MIQPIYTQVGNADIVPCGKKGKPIKSEPIPLLKDNYLGEYRTALQKAKVRKNLGIADSQSLLWGNINGTIEEQQDLVQYIEQKWKYSSDLVENINTVKEAIDYALFFISQYEANTEEIQALRQEFEQIKQDIVEFENNLSDQINNNSTDIEDISNQVTEINQSIELINQSIENIDVDQNILNWITNNLEESSTIKIDTAIEVNISEEDNNAVQVNNGLYVKNLEPVTTDLSTQLTNLKEIQETTNNEIESIQEEIELSTTYQTTLPDDTVSTIIDGTTVNQLKGKSFTEIIDTLIFPTHVRDLVYPMLYYSSISNIVEVGSNLQTPILNFVQNDAGPEQTRNEQVLYNGQVVNSYSSIGSYIHSATVTYSDGDYLLDNKGEITNKRVNAGEISTSETVVATYPWYAGNTQTISKQQLVAFGSSSGVIDISMSGNAIIKLPGSNTTLDSFLVDGGLGYLNVDLGGWKYSEEIINSFPYKVWAKTDSYSSALPHKITFTLKQ